MAENSRMSKLSEKDDECIFSWKLFTGWDYMIGNAETAHNRIASIVMSFKEALLEEAEKKRESRNWHVTGLRILVNTIVLALLTTSAYVVVLVVKRSREPEGQVGAWRRNELTVVMTIISLIFPMIFEVLGLLEQYHPRKTLQIQLARIMVLNLLNLYSLIFALFDEISTMTTRLEGYKKNITEGKIPTSHSNTIETYHISSNCEEICFYRRDHRNFLPSATTIFTALAYNFTSTAFPEISPLLNATIAALAPANFVQPNITWPQDAILENVSVINDMNFTEHAINFTDNGFDYFTENTSFLTTEDINFTVYSDDNSTTGFGVTSPATLEPPLFDIVELSNSFSDYLAYILFNFDYNSTNTTEFMVYNETENYTEATATSTSTGDTDGTFGYSTTYTPSYFDTSTTGTKEFTTTELTTFYETPVSYTTQLNKITARGENCTIVCGPTTEMPPHKLTQKVNQMNYTMRMNLRKLCWETMFGQELVKLTVMDLIMTVLSTMGMDFFRGIFVRYMNRCWCWDLEKKFPQYGDFKVAENILHLVNNQGMVWMGMFFSPGIVVLNVAKLYILMYFRAWIVLSCNVPHEVIFRASRSNNFYYALLLMMLFLCVLPVGYAIVWIKPSWHCGPFSGYDKIFHIFTNTIKRAMPDFEKVLDYIASPGTVIPLLVLLTLIIYYLVSLTAALREANNDLKIQLRRERTEERRKMFQIADRRRRGGSGGSGESNPYNKWKTLLERLPSGKSMDETPKIESEENQQQLKEETLDTKAKDFFSKLMKKALRKSSTSEEENHNPDDGTDTEQHESLPEDVVSIKETKPQIHKPLKATNSSESGDFQKAIISALANKRNQKRLENFKSSTDSSETKHVKIQSKLLKHGSSGSASKREITDRGASCHYREKPSTSRQDSGSSLWSDNIPVITISKTDSAENILEHTSEDRPRKHRARKLSQSEEPGVEKANTEKPSSSYVVRAKPFKPKIKYALKKQSSEIDEDMIFHFGRDAEEVIYSPTGFDVVHEELPPPPGNTLYDEFGLDKSSSDDTEAKESSQDTILNAPIERRSNENKEKGYGGYGQKKYKKESTIGSSVSVETQRSTTDGSSTQTESSSCYKDSTLS